MTDITALRADYEHAIQVTKQYELLAGAALQTLQKACPHPMMAIVQANHVGGIICDRREFRVCRECGYAEQGGGPYLRLGAGQYSGIPTLPQDAAQRFVIGRILTQADLDEIRYADRQATKD